MSRFRDGETRYLSTGTLSDWRYANTSKIELIHPLSPDFVVSGGAKTVAAARRWAVEGRYMLVEGVAPCAHAFYGMNSCPGRCWTRFRQLDHANVWASICDGDQTRALPVLLSAPYSNRVADETKIYAESHGLRISDVFSWLNVPGQVLPDPDGWYGHGSLPIRFVPEETRVCVGQLEDTLILLLQFAPVTWPDDDEVEDALAEADAAYRKSIE